MTIRNWAGVVVALGLLGCRGEQELRDFCTDPPEPPASEDAAGEESGSGGDDADDDINACLPCTADEECVVFSNACHEHATCAHVDSNLGVTQEGCPGLEHKVPPDSECVCTNGYCAH